MAATKKTPMDLESVSRWYEWARARNVVQLKVSADAIEMVLGPPPPNPADFAEETPEERDRRLKEEEDAILFASS